jgi:acyl-CoA reductase-like NAD-dependent aldehyde dehydrogenase
VAVATPVFHVEALGPSGPYSSRHPTVINDVRGVPAAELSMVPVPYVTRAMAALRAARGRTADHAAMLAAAGSLFRDGTVGGLSASGYQHLVSRITGLGITEVRTAADRVAARAEHAAEWSQYGKPLGAVSTRTDPAVRGGVGLWTRRGNVFAVHASGNHPGVHGGWLMALMLGYRVAVRPSRREPLTAHRLVSALWSSGFERDEVMFLPTDYAAADEMLRRADLAQVFGGDDIVEKYRGLQVLPNGPGRSKIVVTAGTDWREHVDLIADSASRGGGAGCVNATAVFVDGPVNELAQAVAERLAQLPSLPPEDPDAVLPVKPLAAAKKMADYVTRAGSGATCLLGGAALVDDLGDGSAVQRASVHVLPAAADPRARIELPFPCLWFVPWSPADGIGPLRDTLIMTVLGADEELLDSLIGEPSIRSVYVGSHPTYWSEPQLPHDGYLSSFLMTPKGFIDDTAKG